MARLYGVVAALLLALLGGSAHASFPAPVTGYTINCQGTQTASTIGELRTICGAARQAYWRANGYPSCVITSGGTGNYVQTSGANCGGNGNFNTPATVISSCPANSTGSSTCTCNAGFTEQGNACYSTSDTLLSDLNNQEDPRVWVEGGTPGTSFCKDGVAVSGSASASTYDGTQHIVYGPFTSSGAACGPDDKPVSTSVTCASGTFPGTVNGVQVCAPRVPDNTIAQGPSTAASAPSPGASAPTIPGAPASAASSSTTTSCTGSGCTTTTTYKDGAGNSVGTITTQQPRSSWCAENPGSPICASGKFSGSCGSPPACSGDAVQCAIATQAFYTRCSLTDEGTETALYDDEKGKEGSQTGALPGNETVAIGSDRFDFTELFGAPQGMQDMTVSIAGTNVTLQMSTVNYWLELLGYLNVAVTLLLCGRILARG